MEKVIVNLKKVQVSENENSCSCKLVFNESIKGFERKIDENGVINYEEGDVNHIYMYGSVLTAQLCDLNEDIALYRGAMENNRPFGQKEYNIALHKAVLTLERTRHTAGEVYGQSEDGTDLVYQRDSYTTDVVDIKISEKALALITQKLLS